MPDITKCANDFCPLRLDCYRYTSPASFPQQSYCVFHPTERKPGQGGHWFCDMQLADPYKSEKEK